jgi:hypothetical protein
MHIIDAKNMLFIHFVKNQLYLVTLLSMEVGEAGMDEFFSHTIYTVENYSQPV